MSETGEQTTDDHLEIARSRRQGCGWFLGLALPVRAALVIAAGLLAGLLMYLIRVTSGLPFFLVTGVTFSAAGAFAASQFVGRATLSQVKVSIPHVSELTFEVNRDVRRVSWQLFWLLRSTILTRPLGAEEGFIREALTSRHTRFLRIRELMEGSLPTPVPDGPTLEWVTIQLFDRLAGFLSTWHPRLARFEKSGADESEWELGATFRRELEELREVFVEFARAFAHLAIHPDPDSLLVAVSGRPIDVILRHGGQWLGRDRLGLSIGGLAFSVPGSAMIPGEPAPVDAWVGSEPGDHRQLRLSGARLDRLFGALDQAVVAGVEHERLRSAVDELAGAETSDEPEPILASIEAALAG